MQAHVFKNRKKRVNLQLLYTIEETSILYMDFRSFSFEINIFWRKPISIKSKFSCKVSFNVNNIRFIHINPLSNKKNICNSNFFSNYYLIIIETKSKHTCDCIIIEYCDLIVWSAWRKFWLYLITWVGIMMSPMYSFANAKFK